jgi:hypothetical protein
MIVNYYSQGRGITFMIMRHSLSEEELFVELIQGEEFLSESSSIDNIEHSNDKSV